MTQRLVRGHIGARSRSALIGGAVGLAFIAFTVAGMVFFDDLREGRPHTWPLVAIATGVAFLVWAVFLFVTRERRTNSATLLCAKVPFMVGEELKGIIETRCDRRVDQGVKVTIVCFHIEDSDEPKTTVIWADDAVIPPAKFSHGNAMCRIPIAFEIPENVPTGRLYHWHIGLYAASNRDRIETFVISVEHPTGRDRSDFPEPIGVQHRIHVHGGGKGHISLGGKRPKELLAYLGSAVSFVFLWFFIRKGDFPFICVIPFIGFAVYPLWKIVERQYAGAHSAIDIDRGTIVLSRGKWRLREVEAHTVRSIEVLAGRFGKGGAPTYDVRLNLIGGKTVVAAPFVASRARAEAIARKIEDILIGLDRAKLDTLFGSADRLNSTP
jgi:hypothetical protein